MRLRAPRSLDSAPAKAAASNEMPTRRPRVNEKVEQQQIVKLLLSVGGRVYVLGTRRAKPPKGLVLETQEQKREWFSTRQTPGISDVLAFVPERRVGRTKPRRALCVECKADGGRLSDAQKEFRDLCGEADVDHVAGQLNDVIAWLIEAQLLRADRVPHYRLPAHLAAKEP